MTGDLDPGEASYRAHMRSLAYRGGATTKQRHGTDPNYYRKIGKEGGAASATARRERFRQQVETEADGCAIAPVPPCPVPVAAPVPSKSGTLDDRVLAFLNGPDSDRDPTGRAARKLLGQPDPAAAAAFSRK
jgi:hypothetical protein